MGPPWGLIRVRDDLGNISTDNGDPSYQIMYNHYSQRGIFVGWYYAGDLFEYNALISIWVNDD
jgi:hypothetical protein